MKRTRPSPHSRRRIFRALLLLVVLATLPAAGCTRRYYRDQADEVADGLITSFANEAMQPLRDDVSFVSPPSRMYDPFNPDFPPMPPDDLIAHSRMHCVDGMRAFNWHKYPSTPVVDDQHWLAYMPWDENGRVQIDMTGAVQLAYVNSREYRKELEDLYLSALDVSFERFRFSAQYFAGNDTFFNADGRARTGAGAVSRLSNESGGQMTKLYAAGGQLVVNAANSIVWQFSGNDTNFAATILDFSFVQPLLRFGGRARTLERLTLVERQLIYNVRQMEQYRQSFYAQVTTGRAVSEGPNRRGGVSGAGLQGFTGFGGGFGRLNVAAGNASGVVDAGGFLGLLQDQIQIRNQEANVTTLRDSLTRLQAEFDADRIKDKFQVELARQALYEGQSRLLASKAAYQTRLDTFKVFLGLPPQLDVDVRDPLLDRFQLIDPETTRLTERAGTIALTARAAGVVTDGDLAQLLDGPTGIRQGVAKHLVTVEADFKTLDENMPQREAQLKKLASRPEVGGDDVPLDAYSVERLLERRDVLRRDLDLLKKGLAETWSELEKLRTDLPKLTAVEANNRLDAINPVLSSQLLALSLAQARARVDAIIWTPIDIGWEEALETARLHRRDWMNARASLVDTWRLIEFNANALKSGLNVSANGDITTLGDNSVKFRDTTGRIRMGVQFDAPLTRVAERNIYRQSLIEYQQARRGYMLFEDRVCQSLRGILRTIELNQLNFEIRRSAVQVAIQQVDLARETLSRPLRPGEMAADYAAARASIGRDLVTALGSLLEDQNNFIAVWVSYEVQRVSLDLEMGTMQLDDRGMWIDPGPVTPGMYDSVPSIEDLPEDTVIGLEGDEILPGPLNPGAANGADANTGGARRPDAAAPNLVAPKNEATNGAVPADAPPPAKVPIAPPPVPQLKPNP